MFIKKIGLIVFPALMAVSLLTACSSSEMPENSTDAPDSATESAGDTVTGGSFSSEDLNIVLNGKTLVLGSSESNITDVFGEANSVEEAVSCMFGEYGYDRTLYYDFCTVFTFPASDGSGNIVEEVNFSGENVPVIGDGAVKIGSTKAEVIAVYGDNFFMQGEMMMVYNVENNADKVYELPMLFFMIEDDVVTSIGYSANLYHPTE